jgi:hypothetical protein
MEYCIETRQNGNSLVQGEFRVVANGGYSEMRSLFPIIVGHALASGLQGVVLYDQGWEMIAQWDRQGILLEAQA